MRRTARRLICASLLAVACSDRDTTQNDGDGDGGSDDDAAGDASGNSQTGAADETGGFCTQPFRADWTVEHEGEFAALDGAGMPRIFDLIVGTPDPLGDNFRNRGDVIVDFTGDPGRIRIELRRFTFACDEAHAQEQFAKLSLWAYNASTGAPQRPPDIDPASDCRNTDEAWLDGCAVYVYYEGQIQLERAGADIRVTLPPEYRQSLEIRTSDNIIEDTYPNRGNVCINNLNASADVAMQSGIALVKLAADATPAPSCSAADVNDCTNVGDPTTTAAMEGAWSLNCACAQQLLMGTLIVANEAPYATDVTVDVPADFWASIVAENEAGGGGENVCSVALDGFADAFVPDAMQVDPEEPWRVIGDANKPSEAALTGGGFGIRLTSSACDPVSAVESPDAWDANVDEPTGSTRGFLRLCVGCLSDNPCDDLPGP